MNQDGWYLLAYDIADNRRLQWVYRRLLRSGLPVQKSVFLVSVTGEGLTDLLDELEGLMHKGQDDLRTYPIAHPGELYRTAGRGHRASTARGARECDYPWQPVGRL
jgi:CRISPR-associated endonuclease Cas2